MGISSTPSQVHSYLNNHNIPTSQVIHNNYNNKSTHILRFRCIHIPS